MEYIFCIKFQFFQVLWDYKYKCAEQKTEAVNQIRERLNWITPIHNGDNNDGPPPNSIGVF